MIVSCNPNSRMEKEQPEIKAESAEIITFENLKFKDLNKNGKVDAYEDWRLSSEERSQDLVKQDDLRRKSRHASYRRYAYVQ